MLVIVMVLTTVLNLVLAMMMNLMYGLIHDREQEEPYNKNRDMSVPGCHNKMQR